MGKRNREGKRKEGRGEERIKKVCGLRRIYKA